MDENKILITVPHKTFIPNKGMGPINKPFYINKDLIKLYQLMGIQYNIVSSSSYEDINEDGVYEVATFESTEKFIEQKYLQINETFKQIRIMVSDSSAIEKNINDVLEKIKDNSVGNEELNEYIQGLEQFNKIVTDKKGEIESGRQEIDNVVSETQNKLDSLKEQLNSFETVKNNFQSNFNNAMSLNDEMEKLSENANYIKNMENDVIRVEEKLSEIREKSETLKLAQESFNTKITNFENTIGDYKTNLKNYMVENASIYEGDPGPQGPTGPQGFSIYTANIAVAPTDTNGGNESYRIGDHVLINNGDLYKKTGVNTYTKQYSIRGAVGSTGAIGYSIYTANIATAPTDTNGGSTSYRTGDYVLINNGDLYKKTGTNTYAKQISIKGPQGDQGPKGDPGVSVPPKVYTRDEYDSLAEKDPNTLYFII
ncbi:hypothetical protein [Staphylococcus phage vB_StaM_SA1]|nr:hypothetical protein [Staphylococcus phage vB_StaM_SA1]